MRVLVKKIDPEAIIPSYAREGDAGADLYSIEDVVLKPMERRAIRTGIGVEVPRGCEAQVRPRSGLALKKGLSIVNTPGTVDSAYRGEIKIIAINLGSEDIEIKKGNRIAQLVINKIENVSFEEAELSETERGEGGFGSTGV